LPSSKLLLIIFVPLFFGSLLSLQYAFGEDSINPIQALWDAIYDLQDNDDKLQSQIDELKASKASADELEGPVGELSTTIEFSDFDEDAGEARIESTVTNDGPDQATGVRLTIFYKMSQLKLKDIPSDQCRDMQRGIIQCDLGTIEAGRSVSVLLDFSLFDTKIQTTFTSDVSATTADRIPDNNHLVVDLVNDNEGRKVIEDPPADAQMDANDATTDQNNTTTNNDNDDQSDESTEQVPNEQTSPNANETSTESESNTSTDSEEQGQYSEGDEGEQSLDENVGEETSETTSEASDDSVAEGAEHEENESDQDSSSGNQTSTEGTG